MPLSFRLGKRDALFDETQGVGHIFLERAYHDLRLGYESRGRIDVARDFYYGELELRYRAKRRLRRIFSLSFLYRFFSGYGRQQGLAGSWLFAFTPTANVAVLTFTSTGDGSNGDLSLSASSATSQPTYFAAASFTPSASGASLSGGTKANPLTASYTPDAWGNLQQSGSFTFAQGFGKNNQITGYTYDAAGNLTKDGLMNTYTYDAEGKMTGSNGAVYTFDPLNSRVRKDNGSSSLEYFYFAGQLMATHNPSSGAWNDYIYANGRLIAESPGAQGSGVTFRLGDHLIR